MGFGLSQVDSTQTLPTVEMMTNMGFYDILQVDPASHERTLKRAFANLARICHPDKG